MDIEMKIELEIPEWANKRRIIILAGTELVAQKDPDWDYWEVKSIRCNYCGQCCMTFSPNSNETPFGVDDEGKCKALRKEGDGWVCGAGVKRPYACLFDPLKENTPECSIVRDKMNG